MIYDGVYKRYKLYTITEQDITMSGGNGVSRYINNTVLVFLPDIEKPEIGTELIATESIEVAKKFIDINTKESRTANEIFTAAIKKSKIQEEQHQAQQRINIIQEDERRKKEQKEEEYIREQRQNNY